MSKKTGSKKVTKKSNAIARERTGTVTVLHVRRWVRWWFYIGIVCGAVALANIFLRQLTQPQEDVILFLGVIFWILGGLVCWAWEGVKIEKQAPQHKIQTQEHAPAHEIGSQVIAERRGEIRLRPAYREQARLLHDYLRRWEQHHHV